MSNPILDGRTVLITGASGTLGSVAAKAAAAAGATVVLMGRNVPRLEQLYDAILAAGGPTPALYPLDLAGASEADYAGLAATVQQELGGLHGLLHGAAELGHLSPLTEFDASHWQRLLHVNLTAPFLLTRAVTPLLLASGGGSVVFLGDSGVGDGKAFWGPYGIAKLGLAGLARMFNAELENRGVRATLFTPGPMRSAIRLRAYPGENLASLATPDTHAAPLMALLGNPHSS